MDTPHYHCELQVYSHISGSDHQVSCFAVGEQITLLVEFNFRAFFPGGNKIWLARPANLGNKNCSVKGNTNDCYEKPMWTVRRQDGVTGTNDVVERGQHLVKSRRSRLHITIVSMPIFQYALVVVARTFFTLTWSMRSLQAEHWSLSMHSLISIICLICASPAACMDVL